MRNEKQVLKQNLDFSNNDVNIRAVIMNGSRVNPYIKKDIFCDYDIVYVVNEPKKYSENRSWISYFGELVILQFNRAEQVPENNFIFLMQFLLIKKKPFKKMKGFSTCNLKNLANYRRGCVGCTALHRFFVE